MRIVSKDQNNGEDQNNSEGGSKGSLSFWKRSAGILVICIVIGSGINFFAYIGLMGFEGAFFRAIGAGFGAWLIGGIIPLLIWGYSAVFNKNYSQNVYVRAWFVVSALLIANNIYLITSGNL